MLPVDAFNARTEKVDEPWERDLAAPTDEFLALGEEQESGSRSFQSTANGDSATASLLIDGLGDDSVRARRYELTFRRRHGRHLADRVSPLGTALPGRAAGTRRSARALRLARPRGCRESRAPRHATRALPDRRTRRSPGCRHGSSGTTLCRLAADSTPDTAQAAQFEPRAVEPESDARRRSPASRRSARGRRALRVRAAAPDSCRLRAALGLAPTRAAPRRTAPNVRVWWPRQTRRA